MPDVFLFFFFNDTATTEIYTLSLHDALPIFEMIEMLRIDIGDDGDVGRQLQEGAVALVGLHHHPVAGRSEEHTSELQSPCNLVCRLLLEKKKKDLNDLLVLGAVAPSCFDALD